MSEFWLWFWRPIAEFLGVVAFVGAILIVIGLGIVLWAIYDAIREKLFGKSKP